MHGVRGLRRRCVDQAEDLALGLAHPVAEVPDASRPSPCPASCAYWRSEASTGSRSNSIIFRIFSQTVNHHVSAVLAKLGVENREAAADMSRNLTA
jgi:hypothetical protein